MKLTSGLKNYRRYTADSDGDLFPNAIDCSDHNPRKQGPLSWIISKATGKEYGQVESERKEARRMRGEERHQETMTQLKRQSEVEKARQPIVEMRHKRGMEHISMEKKRLSLQKQRQAMMPKMGGMGGMSMGAIPPMPKMPSLMSGPSLMKRRKTKK